MSETHLIEKLAFHPYNKEKAKEEKGMGKRKKWWTLGLYMYSWRVRFYYFLSLFFMIIGMNVGFRAFASTTEKSSYLYWTLAVLAAFIYTTYQYTKKAKKEYEDKKLGFENHGS